MECSWSSVVSIIDHFGNFSDVLSLVAGPGSWNDPDMLIVGNDCITEAESQTQFAIWSIMAAPLIMGNDLRNVSNAAREILLNDEAIAIDQDPLARAGGRFTPYGPTEIWTRPLAGGDLAVVFLNKLPNVTTMTLNISQLNWTSSSAFVRDIYAHKTTEVVSHIRAIPFEISPHGCAFLRLSSSPLQGFVERRIHSPSLS